MTQALSKGRLEKIASWRETYGAGHNVMLPAEEAEAMALALLAAHEQEPSATLFKSGDSAKVIMIGSDLPDGYTDVFAHPTPISAAAMPVAFVELSDYVTASGDEPRKKAVKELYEGALVVGQNLYTHPAPSIPAAAPEDEDGQPAGFAKWANRKLPATVGAMTLSYCEDAWRAAMLKKELP